MKKFLLAIFISITGLLQIYGQENLYIPVNMQKAYANETRSMDGIPGKNYWQNSANYEIEVHVYPWSRLLKGNETIIYFNNSPDSLSELVIRLYPDIYKRGNNRDNSLDPAALHDGVLISMCRINNRKIDLNSKTAAAWRSGTVLTIPLADKLLPGEKIKIEMEWQYTIADVSQIRGGAYDATSFFVSYWFPRISVYDDINGWDKSDYTGNQEFYNDFCNYDVKINLPDAYTVWATGVLQNPEDVLPEKQLKLYKKAHSSKDIINIIREKDYHEEDLVMNPAKNPWHFKAENVTDFAFSFSDYYLWDAGNVVVDGQDDPVFVSAAYKPKSMDFYEVALIACQTLKFYSEEMPGVPYPFPELTVFNGRGGMEFPMMINDGTTTNYASTVGLTSHEALHSYFPFYMGTNEKKYAWMDEGMVVALSFDFQLKMAPEEDVIASRVKKYLRIAGNELETPSMVSSLHLRGVPYRNAAYDKPAMAYYFLRDVLGDDLFKKALHTYMSRWNGKHPIPYDFFFTFDEISGEDLSWYWKPWFFDFAYPDLAVKSVLKESNRSKILVEKIGRMPIPAALSITFTDGTTETYYKTAAVWKNNAQQVSIEINTQKEIKSVLLGNSHIPDINPDNNSWENSN
ncbi:MAG: M1 family metallopeptidase [Calditrichae bacterium]|nr:M1 family metallopeptidase [Calditrichia bacterium]